MRNALSAIALLLVPFAAQAQEPLTLGGDIYAAGSSVTLAAPAPRNAIAVGMQVQLAAPTQRDAIAAGFDVNVDGAVTQNLYAAGFSVDVANPVGEDVTAAGFNVRLRPDARVAGNARLAGGTVRIDGPVDGSLLATGGAVVLNGTVAGDARIVAGDLKFGPDARIAGQLTYSARVPVEIPAAVVPAERVVFRKIDMPSGSDVVDRTVTAPLRRLWPSFLGVTFGFVVSVAFLVALAAALLAFTPDTVERLRRDTIMAPFRSLGLGVLVLATMIGLVPVAAMTFVGIPLIPVIVLSAVVFWIVGYLLGVYVVAWRIAGSFRDLPSSTAGRLLVVAAGLVVAAILNFIPFLGWLLNLALVLIGMGGVAMLLLRRIAGPGIVASTAPMPAAPTPPVAAEPSPPSPAAEPGSDITPPVRRRPRPRKS